MWWLHSPGKPWRIGFIRFGKSWTSVVFKPFRRTPDIQNVHRVNVWSTGSRWEESMGTLNRRGERTLANEDVFEWHLNKCVAEELWLQPQFMFVANDATLINDDYDDDDDDGCSLQCLPVSRRSVWQRRYHGIATQLLQLKALWDRSHRYCLRSLCQSAPPLHHRSA